MSTNSSTFCVLPWVHLASLTDGSAMLCCVARNELKLNLNKYSLTEVWNSSAVRDARRLMLKGEKVAACAGCYAEEASGCRSHRVTENQVWRRRMGEEWVQKRIANTSADGYLADEMVALDLRLGNTCNLQCVMCRPQDSSKWLALAKKLANSCEDKELKKDWQDKSNINSSQFEWYKRDDFWQSLRQIMPHLRELIFGGGEPMLLSEHQKLLELCVESGAAAQIHLRYHTNLTTFDPKLFTLWQQFHKVEVFVSLDGIGERNQYFRYPSKWDDIVKNLKLIDAYPHKNFAAMILCSVHALNIYYLPELAEWIEQQNFKVINKGFTGYFHPGIVHYPPYLSTQVLPDEFKDKVAEKILDFERRSLKPSNKLEGVINLMKAKNESQKMPTLREYLLRLDENRSVKFSQACTEISPYFGF